MVDYQECRKCRSSQINEGTLNHFADCPDHPNKIAAERLQAQSAQRELAVDKTVGLTQNPGTSAVEGSTILQPTMFSVPPVVFKGIMELKLNEESAREAFSYYLTTVMNTPNIEVLSVSRNAKKEFVVKFKGK